MFLLAIFHAHVVLASVLSPSKEITIKKKEVEEKVYIFDESFTYEELCYFKRQQALIFGESKATFSFWNGVNDGGSPFKAQLKDLYQFDFITKLVEASRITGKKLNLEKGFIEYIRTGDVMPVTTRFCKKKCPFVISIFLEEIWKLNSYGQVSFYDYRNVQSAEKTWIRRLESIASFDVKPFRSVLWPSCTHVLFRPPCVNHHEPLTVLHIFLTEESVCPKTFTTDLLFFNLNENNSKKKLNEKMYDLNKNFTDGIKRIEFGQYLVKSFYENGDQNRHIHVYDDVFSKSELDDLINYLKKNSNLMFNKFDRSLLEENDNVPWISQFDVDDFVQTRLWLKLQGLLKYVSNEDGWYPYDIALNVVQSTDSPRIHSDSENHQVEYTIVIYLSDDIHPDECGNIVFVQPISNKDSINRFLGERGRAYEIIGSASPKFGRLVIFRNNIEHSARPPCGRFLGARYSFAVKVSRSYRLALIKEIYEIGELIPTSQVCQQYSGVLSELLTSKHDDASTSNLTDGDLEELYTKLKKQKEEMFKNKEIVQV